jgi:3-deoxy-7-phosphoheptulonate synthase
MKDITESDLKERIPLATKKHEDHKTIVRVGNTSIGDNRIVVMAGPCAVENREQVIDIAQHVKKAGAALLRGGAYKPLTFPYRTESFFELRETGLEYLQEAGKISGLPVVTEVMDPRLVDTVAAHADVLQIGARSMQNFPLLEEAAKTKKPVLLKRNFGCSIRDWLGAAEYVLYEGNPNVILCERGVVAAHTHAISSRFIVDIQAIPAVKEYSHLPVVVDPSHATFKRKYVAPVARAAIAAGADGILLDVHPVPEKAAVDPLQALSYESFSALMEQLRGIAHVVGRSL